MYAITAAATNRPHAAFRKTSNNCSTIPKACCGVYAVTVTGIVTGIVIINNSFIKVAY